MNTALIQILHINGLNLNVEVESRSCDSRSRRSNLTDAEATTGAHVRFSEEERHR